VIGTRIGIAFYPAHPEHNGCSTDPCNGTSHRAALACRSGLARIEPTSGPVGVMVTFVVCGECLEVVRAIPDRAVATTTIKVVCILEPAATRVSLHKYFQATGRGTTVLGDYLEGMAIQR